MPSSVILFIRIVPTLRLAYFSFQNLRHVFYICKAISGHEDSSRHIDQLCEGNCGFPQY